MSILSRKMVSLSLVAGFVTAVALISAASASDWSRFRGPNGSGFSADSAATPTTWGDNENLQWSVDLPGQGVSCPIVVGDRVYVTSWTGTGPDDLQRHLVGYDRKTGQQVLAKQVAPAAKDEPFEGMFQQTGYTANTPAADGERIYCFFGVSGVYAFDNEGNEIWHKSVGTNFDERNWGTASSLVLTNDLVIVTAASESNSLIALRKSNGEEVWRYESPQLDATWSTPIVVDLADGRQELVLSAPGAVWAFDPATGPVDGQPKWTCKGAESNSACASPVVHDGIVYAIGGRDGGGMAIRAGGSGDVTETHVVWSGNQRARIGTPVYHDGLIYWFSDGMANCIDAATGEKVYQQRLKAQEAVAKTGSVFQLVADETPAAETKTDDAKSADAPQAQVGDNQADGKQGDDQRQGRRRGRGGRGGRGGFMAQDYASPVAADGKLYFQRRGGEVFVFALGREFEQLAVNKFSGEADYSATPAIADGQIFVRSSKKLYCVAKE